MSEANGHREQLEQRANEVRSKLERRLKLIDERGHLRTLPHVHALDAFFGAILRRRPL